MRPMSKVLRYEDCFETLEEARAEIKRLHEARRPTGRVEASTGSVLEALRKWKTECCDQQLFENAAVLSQAIRFIERHAVLPQSGELTEELHAAISTAVHPLLSDPMAMNDLYAAVDRVFAAIRPFLVNAKAPVPEGATPETSAGLPAVPQVELSVALKHLRTAWEAGWLSRRYGDNWVHFEGEQKERHWQQFLTGVDPAISEVMQHGRRHLSAVHKFSDSLCAKCQHMRSLECDTLPVVECTLGKKFREASDGRVYLNRCFTETECSSFSKR